MVAGLEMKKVIFLFAVVSAIAAKAAWLPANAPDLVVADGAADAKIEIAGDSTAAAVRISSGSPLTFVRMRWDWRFGGGSKFFGGDWERTYGKTALSTVINSVSTCPFATKEAKYCGISVDGVIGKAGNTSGLICLSAIATASFPDKRSLLAILFYSFHCDCTEWT